MEIRTVIYLSVFAFVSIGLLKVFGFNIGESLEKEIDRRLEKKTLAGDIKAARGKKPNYIISELLALKTALDKIGKGQLFGVSVRLSAVLFAAGLLVPAFFGNLFLSPVMAIVSAAIPFVIIGRYSAEYDRRVKDQLETTLSIITNSYIRTEDFVGSVRENIPVMKQPIRSVFEGFIKDVTLITPDIDAALMNLRGKVDNAVFREWCDGIRACLEDRSLKDTLLSTVSKYTDIRLINNELKTIVQEPRKEYFIMAAMTLANIPFLRIINRSWYEALVSTIPGKVAIAVVFSVILITGLYMMKYTRPIEYGGR
ncbi:MAG: hypothetical protein IJS71_01265 [Clostridia bacterium]|nr:hypothetical protein [Clostridia bacterium]